MAARMMVVDDEPDLESLIRQKFRREIRENEYEFLFAQNGVEALAKLADNPDLSVILTDINMPEMDGLTLLERLADLRKPILKAVVISAYADIENIRTAMNRGAFDFLTKPIDFADLEKTIQRSRAGAKMSVSRSVAEVLHEHVTLEVEGIDRMYLNVYITDQANIIETGDESYRFRRTLAKKGGKA